MPLPFGVSVIDVERSIYSSVVRTSVFGPPMASERSCNEPADNEWVGDSTVARSADHDK